MLGFDQLVATSPGTYLSVCAINVQQIFLQLRVVDDLFSSKSIT